MKFMIRKRPFTACLIFAFICLFLFNGYNFLVEPFYSDRFPCKNLNDHFFHYELAVSKLNALPQLHLIVNFKRRLWLMDSLLRSRITVMINHFYSRDLFFTSDFMKRNPRYLSRHGAIPEFERENKALPKFSLSEVEAELEIKHDSLSRSYSLMKK